MLSLKPTNSFDILSNQEQKIIHLIGKGLQNRAIADILFISTHTVKNHKSNIINKLKLNSTTDLMRFAVLYTTKLQNEESVG